MQFPSQFGETPNFQPQKTGLSSKSLMRDVDISDFFSSQVPNPLPKRPSHSDSFAQFGTNYSPESKNEAFSDPSSYAVQQSGSDGASEIDVDLLIQACLEGQVDPNDVIDVVLGKLGPQKFQNLEVTPKIDQNCRCCAGNNNHTTAVHQEYPPKPPAATFSNRSGSGSIITDELNVIPASVLEDTLLFQELSQSSPVNNFQQTSQRDSFEPPSVNSVLAMLSAREPSPSFRSNLPHKRNM